MAKRENEKVTSAKQMFVELGWSSRQIAKSLGNSISTVNRWIKKHNWELERAAHFGQKKELVRHFYGQIKAITERAKELDRPLDSKEADSINKLTASIRNLEAGISISDYIQVMTEFAQYLKSYGTHELVRQFIGWQQTFIEHKINQL